jgi:hypothetical protein
MRSFSNRIVDYIPTIIAPKVVDDDESFMISVSAKIVEARIVEVGEKDNGLSTEVCADLKTLSWGQASDAERKAAERIELNAKLVVAGVKSSPDTALQLKPDGMPIYFAVYAKNIRRLKGWVAIEPKNKSEVHINADSSRGLFSTRIGQSFPPSLTLFSIVGSVAGALLASIPAWLVWYDKRKEGRENRAEQEEREEKEEAQREKEEAKTIIIP